MKALEPCNEEERRVWHAELDEENIVLDVRRSVKKREQMCSVWLQRVKVGTLLWRVTIEGGERKNRDYGRPGLPQSFLVSSSAAAAAKSLQSCLTLCDPIDGSPPGSPVPGILQAGTLEWVAISFSNAGKWEVKVKSLSRVQLLATPWTAAYQAPLSMGFSRQEYWSGVPLPSPGIFI